MVKKLNSVIMALFVPVNIKTSDNGLYEGSFPFERQFVVRDSSRDKLVEQLYKQVARYYHRTKKCDFEKTLASWNDKSGFSFIKLGYFSRLEIGVLSSIVFMVFALVYYFISHSMIVAAIQRLPNAKTLFDSSQKVNFEQLSQGWMILQHLGLLYLWSLIYQFMLPFIIRKYESLVKRFDNMKSLHRRLITAPCMLFCPHSELVIPGQVGAND